MDGIRKSQLEQIIAFGKIFCFEQEDLSDLKSACHLLVNF